MTAVLLASKVEVNACVFCIRFVTLFPQLQEAPRKPRDVLNVFDRVLKKQQNLPLIPFDVRSTRYEEWRSAVKALELTVLGELVSRLILLTNRDDCPDIHTSIMRRCLTITKCIRPHVDRATSFMSTTHTSSFSTSVFIDSYSMYTEYNVNIARALQDDSDKELWREVSIYICVKFFIKPFFSFFKVSSISFKQICFFFF